MSQLRTLSDAIRLDLALPREPSPYLLETQALGYRIAGKPILAGVNCQLMAGEVLAVLGQNGAGKSTLLKLLSGDLRPSDGAVMLEGLSLALYSAAQLALKRAVMGQGGSLAAGFTAGEVVALGRYPRQRYYKHDPAADEALIRESLARCDVAHLRDQAYNTLSGGEQARVTLARVLAQETPILLLDEPTAALDLRHQQQLMQIVRELAAEGRAVLMILHDLNLAAAYADRILIMRGGAVFAEGAPAEVLTEGILEAAFELPVKVIPHPAPPRGAACPLVIPLGGRR
jgi:iron complex transport system ATP-binding protein